MKFEIINNKEKWNRFIESHEFSHAFQLYEWGEIKKNQGWQPVRLGLLDERGNINAGSQILFKKLPIFSLKIAQIPFGPVLDYDNPELLKFFFNHFYQFIKTEKYALLFFEPYSFFNKNIKIIRAKESLNQLYYHYTILIDLTKSEENIFHNFRPTYQNEIRQTEKKEVKVIENSTENGINEFYKMYASTYQRTKRTPLPQKIFNSIATLWFPTGNARLFFSEYNHQKISAALILYSGKTCVYMFAASSVNSNLNRLPGQKLLTWYVIKESKNNGYRFFDLGGVTPTAKQGTKRWGIYFFKKGFGGELMRLTPTHEIGCNPLLTRFCSLLLKVMDVIKK